MKKKLPLIIAFLIAVAAIAGTVIFLVTKLSEDKDNNEIDTTKDNVTNVADTDGNHEPDGNKEPDGNADRYADGYEDFVGKNYFEERAEIISVIPVKDSPNTLSEQQVILALKARGLDQYPVTTRYSFDGEFGDSITASESSSDKHPIYETYFVTSKNEIWVITSINGTVTAYPVSYNLAHPDQVPIELSESEQIASYDYFTNSVYITKPKTSVLNVRVVKKIDIVTLESIDLEVN